MVSRSSPTCPQSRSTLTPSLLKIHSCPGPPLSRPHFIIHPPFPFISHHLISGRGFNPLPSPAIQQQQQQDQGIPSRGITLFYAHIKTNTFFPINVFWSVNPKSEIHFFRPALDNTDNPKKKNNFCSRL